MTVIELGELTPGSDLPTAVPHGYNRHAVRLLALFAVTVLCVLTATGSARPESTMLRTLWSIPYGEADRYALTGDSLYATTRATGDRLTAYDLATGKVRWSAPMPEPNGWLISADAAGILLLSADRVAKEVDMPDGTSYLSEYYRQTVAVDGRTGAELWRAPGETFAITRTAVLLVDRAGPDGDTTSALRLVGLRDGAVRWSRHDTEIARTTPAGPDPYDPDLLVTVSATGEAEVLRMSDGSRTAAGRIAFRATRPSEGEFVDVFADDRNLYLRTASGRGDSLAAYPLATLRESWRQYGVARVAAYPCGAVVCGMEAPGLTAFDPDTGRQLWTEPKTVSVWPIGPGRLVSDGGSSDVYSLVDDVTGRRVAWLGPGLPVASADGTTAYLLRDTRSPVGGTAVLRVDLETGEVGLRGAIDRITDYGCTATATTLACSTLGGALVVVGVG